MEPEEQVTVRFGESIAQLTLTNLVAILNQSAKKVKICDIGMDDITIAKLIFNDEKYQYAIEKFNEADLSQDKKKISKQLQTLIKVLAKNNQTQLF